MKEEKFKVIQYSKELIVTIEKELNNFPKKDIEIKNRIRTNSYDLLEILFLANTLVDVPRKKAVLREGICKVKVIDFLLSLSDESNLITHKKYLKLGMKMDDVIKYMTGWLKKLEENRD